MNVAIITWFNSGLNYGQTLQAFALQQFLFKNGVNAYIVDYNPDIITQTEKLNISDITKLEDIVLRSELYSKDQLDKFYRFNYFVEDHLQLTGLCLRKRDISRELKKQNCEAVICGGDQIWNISYGINDVFYANFPDLWQLKKISYAPSIGRDSFSEEEKDRFQMTLKLIERFDSITVREKSSAELISKNINRPVGNVIDPVFLLSREEWSQVENKVQIQGKYIFCYLVGEAKPYEDDIIELAAERGLRIIFTSQFHSETKLNQYSLEEGIGPGEFLSLIAHASFVIGDSYHVALFSIIYGRELILKKRIDRLFAGFDRDVRFWNLLELFGEEKELHCDREHLEKYHNIILKEQDKSGEFFRRELNL